MNLKFMYNGIKLDGKLYKGSYSKGSYHPSSNIPAGSITIYARDYKSFPKVEGLNIENNTDTMTDYFDNDKIRVTPDNKYYKEVNAAFEKQEAKRQARFNKRMAN